MFPKKAKEQIYQAYHDAREELEKPTDAAQLQKYLLKLANQPIKFEETKDVEGTPIWSLA